MEIPLEITYREAAKNDLLEDLIRAKAPRLEEIQEDIVSCRISVERVQGHQRSGSPYRIRIVMCIPPDKELVVSPKPGAEEASEQLKTTVNRAFEAMRRQVVRQKEKQLGEVKTHADAAVPGHVVRLNPGENFGFLRSLEGREIDFHRNSVVHDDFERLDIGTGVRHAPGKVPRGPGPARCRSWTSPAPAHRRFPSRGGHARRRAVVTFALEGRRPVNTKWK